MPSCQHDLPIRIPAWTPVTLSGTSHLSVAGRVEGQCQCWMVSHNTRCVNGGNTSEGRNDLLHVWEMASLGSHIWLRAFGPTELYWVHSLHSTVGWNIYYNFPLLLVVCLEERRPCFPVQIHLWASNPLEDIVESKDSIWLKRIVNLIMLKKLARDEDICS